MQAAYQAKLQGLRLIRAQTLRVANGLTQAQSEFSQAAGKWSVGEVLDHLVLSEGLYREQFAKLIDLQKAGQKPVVNIRFAEVNTSIGFIPKPLLDLLEIPFTVANFFMPSVVREAFVQYRLIPAQAPAVAEPRKGRPLSELRKDLRSSLQETEALFEANPNLDYEQMRASHPLMGDNNVPQLLQIIASHEQRHQSQIEDIVKSAAFPRSDLARASAIR